MIACSIGRIFLDEYNKRTGENKSAKDFFHEVMFPLFYDHPKYMLWVTNSPFVQGYKKGQYDKQDRTERLEKLDMKMKNGHGDASYAIGFPSGRPDATTSGQVTNMDFPLETEDYYYSWIASGLGVGIKGGISIYFMKKEILWNIYEGWERYRSLLSTFDELRPNQIETWNGQWLTYYYEKQKLEPLARFDPKVAVKDSFEMPTMKWTDLMINLSVEYGTQLSAYIYSYGQMNTTIGFIPLQLPNIRKPIDFYKEIFGENDYVNNSKAIKSIYGTAFGFQTACQKGMIGTPALEPKEIKDYIIGSKKNKIPNFKKNDEQINISLKTYQTWILAMLNNKELWDKADKAAQSYLQFVEEGKNLSTKHKNMIEELFTAFNKRKFIESNTDIIKVAKDAIENINEVVMEVNSMPEESFKYFATLIKFRYYYHLNNQK